MRGTRRHTTLAGAPPYPSARSVDLRLVLSPRAGRVVVSGGPALLLSLVVAFVCGALAVSVGAVVVYRVMAARLDAAAAKADTATDRLVSAWNSGVVIPAPAEPEAEPEPAPDPFIAEWLEQWDENGRAVYAQKARQMARNGLSGPEVVAALDRQRSALLS